MQALTSCECTICPDCFRQHFTIALKEKHITDMVCPACGRPDLTDDTQLLSYFSTLDIQVLQSLGLGVPWALNRNPAHPPLLHPVLSFGRAWSQMPMHYFTRS